MLGIPDVVVPAEDHAPFAIAGGADLTQLCLAARALQAARVPIAFHGEEQEAVRDAATAACTRSACSTPTSSSSTCYSHS